MFKTALLSLIFLGCALAQTVTPPAPPACLSGPVTVGTITLTCSMIDATGGGSDNNAVLGGFLFAVKATSSDISVPALQIQVAFQSPVDSNPAYRRSVTVTRGQSGAFTYIFTALPIGTGAAISAPAIAEITIQELKPSSSQSF